MKQKIKMFNLKWIILIFFISKSVNSKLLNEPRKYLEYIPPPTVNYRHSITVEAKHCIEICEECFNKNTPFSVILLILLNYI